MYRNATEIISTEITNWDSIIRFYKNLTDFLTHLKYYLDKTEDADSRLQLAVEELVLMHRVYEQIYVIIGDSTQEYLTKLGVPNIELIAQLEHEDFEKVKSKLENKQTLNNYNFGKVQLSGINEKKGAYLFTGESNEQDKLLVLSYFLANMISCQQFFTLCELRKNALTKYSDLVDLLKNVLQQLPEDFYLTIGKNFSFEGADGFDIDAAAIIQRFVKYQSLGLELLKQLPEEPSISKDDKTQYLIAIANILWKLGSAYSSWDNKARHIAEKVDPRKQQLMDDSQYNLFTQYKNNLVKDREEVEATICNLKKKLALSKEKQQENPKRSPGKYEELLTKLVFEINDLEKLHEGQRKAIQRLDELKSGILKKELLGAKEFESTIQCVRAQASVLLQLINKDLGITVREFNLDLPLHDPYKPDLSIKQEEMSKSPPLSPRSPRFRFRSHTVASPNNSPKPIKAALMRTLNTSVENVKAGVDNVKDYMKKASAARSASNLKSESPKIERQTTKISLNLPSLELNTVRDLPKKVAKKFQKPTDAAQEIAPETTPESESSVMLQETRRQSPLVTRFYAEIEKNQLPEKEKEAVMVPSRVRSRVNNIEQIEKIAIKGERLSRQLPNIKERLANLEKEFANLEPSSPKASNLGRHMLVNQFTSEVNRGRANTAPSSSKNGQSNGEPTKTPVISRRLN